MPLGRTLLAALAAGLLLAAPARSETLESDGGMISYVDEAPASVNHLLISAAAGDFIFFDSALVNPFDPCSSTNLLTGKCPSAGVAQMLIALREENDEMVATSVGVPMLVLAGSGDDTVTAGTAADSLAGNPGDDTIHGGPGPDRFEDDTFGYGGGGDDKFYGDGGDDSFQAADTYPEMAAGADRYDGGAGVDTVEYTEFAGGSVVDLVAGTARSGADADTLAGIENVKTGDGGDLVGGDGAANRFDAHGGDDALAGGGGGDRLEGGAGSDDLEGGPGPDVIHGGADFDTARYDSSPGPVLITLDDQPGDGQDGENDNVGSDVERVRATPFADHVTAAAAANVVLAGAGADTVDGGEGGDEIRGEAGDDDLVGGPGGDNLVAGAGADRVEGGTGDDAIDVVDGEVDKVTCGIGIDTVLADADDVLFDDCELVMRTPAGAPPATGTSPAPTTGTAASALLALTGSKLRIGAKGAGRIRMRCAGAPCQGILRLKAGLRTLARAAYSLQPGAATSVRFRLNRKGRALLRRRGRLAVQASAGGAARRYALVRR